MYEQQEVGFRRVFFFDAFELFVFKRSYSDIGSFQLFVNANSKAIKYLKENRIIQYAPKKAGIIEKIYLQQQIDDSSAILTVYGRELKGITSYRITIPPTGQDQLIYQDSPTETITKGLIDKNIINPVDSNRQILNTINKTNNQIGTVRDYATRYDVLSEEISTILIADNLGWYADIENDSICFEVFEGLDRTEEQTENSKIALRLSDGRLESVNYTHSLENHYNLAYTGGQGEGKDREVVAVGDSTGLNRRELFIDARDITGTDILTERALDKLAEYGDSTTINAVASQWLIDKYVVGGVGLGDKITIILDEILNLSIDARITEIEEVFEENDLSLNLTLGYDLKSLKKILNRRLNKTAKTTTI